MCVYVDYTHIHIHAQSCPALCDPMDCSQPGFSPQNFPGKNTGVGCHFLLQRSFPTQGSNLCLLHLLHWQADSLPMSYQGSLIYTYTHLLGCIKSKYERFLNYAFSISELKCIGFKWKKQATVYNMSYKTDRNDVAMYPWEAGAREALGVHAHGSPRQTQQCPWSLSMWGFMRVHMCVCTWEGQQWEVKKEQDSKRCEC